MISHNFPNRDTALSSLGLPGNAGHSSRASASDCVRSVRSAGHGPLRVELHIAARLQGARVDPWSVSLGARPRRLRGSLLLSGAGSAGDRRRRECADGGDRGVDRALSALFGRARAVRACALRHERDAQDRRRGPGDPDREPQEPCRHHRDGRVRRPRSQVSDLGARPFPRELAEATEKVRALKGSWAPGSAAHDAHGARE